MVSDATIMRLNDIRPPNIIVAYLKIAMQDCQLMPTSWGCNGCVMVCGWQLALWLVDLADLKSRLLNGEIFFGKLVWEKGLVAWMPLHKI
jgi:hypothetical protein